MKIALLIPAYDTINDRTFYIWDTPQEKQISGEFNTIKEALQNKPQGYIYKDEEYNIIDEEIEAQLISKENNTIEEVTTTSEQKPLENNLELNKGDIITVKETTTIYNTGKNTFDPTSFTHKFIIDRVNKNSYSCTYIDGAYKQVSFKWAKTNILNSKGEYFKDNSNTNLLTTIIN